MAALSSVPLHVHQNNYAAQDAFPRNRPVPAQTQDAAPKVMANAKKTSDGSKKEPPPTPPIVIRDDLRNMTYTRMRFLGEGGFARVFEVLSRDGKSFAAKVIYKPSLDSSKKKTKLYAEIKIHRMMAHPHIVQFVECFEDQENVYMLLDLCPYGNMMDMLRRRKHLSEPEARFYAVQIIGACQYMHKCRIMHRDLKLGNFFLDRKMNVKVGDFGLAALIEKEGDRRRTVCGTPNYIAPEVLYGSKAEGHSYEVDVWSLGVIIYTMLFGRPPFQTKDVKTIYQNIKELKYSFPDDTTVSPLAMDLIRSILTSDPKARPSLDDILADPWFVEGTFPDRIPSVAHDSHPDFSHITLDQSRANFAKAKRDCAIGQNLPLAVPHPVPGNSAPTNSAQARQAMAPAIAQQEREFKAAVKPDSPIAALLSSARKPPVVAPSLPTMPRGEPSLLRKFQSQTQNHTAKSPLRKERARARPAKETRQPYKMEALGEEEDIEEFEDVQMDKASDPPVKAKPNLPMSPAAEHRKNLRPGESVHWTAAHGNAHASRAGRSSKKVTKSSELYDTVLGHIMGAMQSLDAAQPYQHPDLQRELPVPKVFISSWLDYVHKYGMGFALTDGSVGVHFNDSTAMVFAPDKQTIDHIVPSTNFSETMANERAGYSIDQIPADAAIQDKVYLLDHFQQYMANKLNTSHAYTWHDHERKHGMVFLAKYWRMKYVIAFRLSNDILQFNFHDHTKLIIACGGLLITFIDADYRLWTWPLSEFVNPYCSIEGRERRRIVSAWKKIEYAANVIEKINSGGQKSSGKAATQGL